MKKLLLVTAAVIALTSVGTAAEAAAPTIIKETMPIEVLVNARKVQFPDAKPTMENNQILVPIRFVSDKLKGNLTLVGKEITIVKGDRTVKLVIGAKQATVNGKPLQLGITAKAVSGRTYVPLRFISEALGENVEWDAVTRFVWIGNKQLPELKDIAKPVSLTPYMSYFKGREYVLKTWDENYNPITLDSAYVIDSTYLPFTINGEAFYRYDLAFSQDGQVYVKATTTDKGSIATQIYFIGKNSALRYRNAFETMTKYSGNFRIHYYPVTTSTDKLTIDDSNYADYKISNADYIGLASQYNAAILIKNPLN
jgi:hypothetical protein